MVYGVGGAVVEACGGFTPTAEATETEGYQRVEVQPRAHTVGKAGHKGGTGEPGEGRVMRWITLEVSGVPRHGVTSDREEHIQHGGGFTEGGGGGGGGGSGGNTIAALVTVEVAVI